MLKRNKLEEWYEGKISQYDISECGMVNTINLDQLSKLKELKGNNSIFDYADSKGESDLIKMICSIYSCHKENILITSGASEALFIVLLSLIEKCKKITCQSPYYNELGGFLKKVKCGIKKYELKSDSHFSFDYEQFKRVFSADSNVAILNFPNNPTGSELKDCDYIDIIRYSEDNNKIVIFDEVASLSINGTYMEKNIQKHLNNCICINSMSKAYGVPGLRVGWIVASKAIINECQAIKELVSICTPFLFQKIALDLLRNRDNIISNNQQIVIQNTAFLEQRFKHYNSLFTINCIPKNSMCCFVRVPNKVNDFEFCSKLYENYNVLLAPGACFGLEGYFRLGLGINQGSFERALDLMDIFINENYSV